MNAIIELKVKIKVIVKMIFKVYFLKIFIYSYQKFLETNIFLHYIANIKYEFSNDR